MMGNMSGNKTGPWVMLGALLMVIVGGFKFIAGIIGLGEDQFLVSGYDGYYLVDVTGLAIWWLLVGVLLMTGGVAAIQGKTWGYVVGIVAASLAAISEFFSIPYTPIWSIIMIAIYIGVLMAFVRAPAQNK
jgi:hypothetical protein